MRRLRLTLSVFLAVQLLFLVPVGTHATGPIQTNAANTTAIQASLNQSGQPRQAKTGQTGSYLNQADYPLVSSGQNAGTLVDSWGTSHVLTYNSTTDYSSSQMKVELGYQSGSSNKDGLLNIEFYTNQNGSLNYLGYVPFDVSGTSNANLDAIIAKSLYTNDPYIYIRVGITTDSNNPYYSDALTFKVNNPDYSGSAAPPASQGDVLISNESTDGNSSENAGSFQINNSHYTFDKKLGKNAYRMDYVKPFDPAKYNSKIIQDKRSLVQADQLGSSKSFWVTNLVTNAPSQISATLEYSGTHANVWVNANQITSADAAKLGQEFDTVIYPLDVSSFGNAPNVDGTGKINILCYDIQDGFNGSGGYVAGYFSPEDLYNTQYSNYSEIFYIDTYPLMGTGATKDVTQAYSTLAHEFQHMINYNEKALVQGNQQGMDTWMNEGLSMAAEQIFSGQALSDRIDYYNTDSSITGGQSLLYWDYNGDTLANYSLSYLFMQYLKIQCGQGDRIFKELIDDPNTNYLAVQDMIHKYIDPNLTFGKFMTDFREALFLNQSTGLFGFHGDAGFQGIQPKIYSGGSPLSLQGGGAVVAQINGSSVPSDKGPDVTYTDLGQAASTAPAPPTVNAVNDNDTIVSGQSEAGDTITVTANGQQIGQGTAGGNGLFMVSIPKQQAGTVLSVYATDAAGHKSAPASVTVQAAPSLPAMGTVDEPADGSTVQGMTTVRGWFLDGSGVSSVDVYVDGHLQGRAQYGLSRSDVETAYPNYGNSDSGFQYALDTRTLSTGRHTLTVTETGTNGGTTSRSLTVNVANLPAVGVIDNPAGNGAMQGTSLVRGWFLDGSGVSKVDVYVDNQYQGSATYGLPRSDVYNAYKQYGNNNSGYQFNLDTSKLTNGKHTLSVKETGANGAQATVSRTIAVLNAMGVIDDPGSGSTLQGTSLVRGWFLDGNGVAKVEAFIDGKTMGSAAYGLSRPDVYNAYPFYGNGSSGYQLSLDTRNITDGAHNLSVIETGAGGVQTTLSRTVTVHNLTPRGVIDDPGSGSALQGTSLVRGWFLDGSGVSKVDVYVDNQYQGSATYGLSRSDVYNAYPRYGNNNSGYQFNLDTSKLTNGAHTLSVKETGADGGQTTVTRTVTVLNAMGVIDDPGSGSTLQGTSLVRGWFLDGSGVSKVDVYVDGQYQGSAAYGLSRPDVYNAYPFYGNSLSGYQLSLDTRNITDGTHKLSVIETGTGGVQTTVSRMVTVRNLTTKGVIDDPGSGSALQGTSLVRGWFLDGSGVSKVDVYVDNQYQGSATLGLSRPDVYNAYPRYGNNNSGYQFNLDTSKLNYGTHTLAVKETGTDGSQMTVTRTVILLNSMGVIDDPGPGSTLQGTSLVRGWFLDGSGVTKVDVYVDNQYQGTATYGLPRTDVYSAYPLYGNKNAGYQYNLNTNQLSAGSHTLKVTETGANGQQLSITRTVNAN